MCLHYLVKLIARVLSPYITNTPCFVTKVTFHNSLNVKMFTNIYRKCWFAAVILFSVTVCSKFCIKCVITLNNGCMWLKESKNTKNSNGNIISITDKEYIMYISKHDENSCWLLKTVVSTFSENLTPKVHNLYGEMCNVWRQNSCDTFYKVV